MALPKKSIGKSIFRLLTFQTQQAEFLQLDRRHLIAGIIGTWLVGMGRYWDDPGAKLLQHLGLGSVIYIFVLAVFIWLIVKPYRVKNWSYFHVLTFISLTSFPAIFYAIPVERFFAIETAATLNVWFLAVVAIWRLSLLYFFLYRFTDLGHLNIVVVTLLPMCLIVTALTILNLERAVFNIMGGIRAPNSANAAYEVLLMLTMISALLVIPLILMYLAGIYMRWKKLKDEDF